MAERSAAASTAAWRGTDARKSARSAYRALTCSAGRLRQRCSGTAGCVLNSTAVQNSPADDEIDVVLHRAEAVLVADPHLRARRMSVGLYGSAGPYVRQPLTFDGQIGRTTQAVPQLGEHNAELLGREAAMAGP